MELLPQVLVNGLIIGGTYALMAIGLTLIFGFMDLVNFAHGELYMLGAHFTYTFVSLAGLPFWTGFLLALAAVYGMALVVDRLLLRPLRREDVLSRMLTTIGLGILLQNLALVIWGPVPKRVPPPVTEASLSLLGVRFAPLHLLVALVALALIGLAHWLMQNTSQGVTMRATFQDREMAAGLGVPTERVYSLTFALGAALAAAGGGLLSTIFIVTPTMGALASLKAFSVVILGGLGNFLGAIAGGLIIGVVESLGASYLWAEFKDGFAFVVLLAILLIRPTGIFGKASGVD